MTPPICNVTRITFLSIVLVAVTACGGGGSTPPPMYSIGGTVSGLDAGNSVVLRLNDVNEKTVSTDGAFNFATMVAGGSAYAVTVGTFPVGGTCAVNGGAGTASANVTSVAVTCVITPTYSIGGAVSGLIGHGLELAHQELTGSYSCHCTHFETRETAAVDKNGNFVFATKSRGGYLVTIQQQPQSPSQRCAVQNRLGGIMTADVSNVDIVCGEFAHVTNAAGNAISALGIDAATGAMITASTVATGGISPYPIASTPDKKLLYVGNGGSNDISAFVVDASSGALTAVPGSPFAAGTIPQSLAVTSSIARASVSSAFFAYSRLYVANAGSDNLSAYEIDEMSGGLTPLSPATYATGAGPSAIAILPWTPKILYVANAGGSNDISVFEIGDSSGSLTPLAASPFPSGRRVRSLAFGSAGTFLYAADANGGAAAIYGFRVDPPDSPTRGALTPLVGLPLSLPSCTFIVADQAGMYLYATTGTDLLGYSIDATTGALTALSGFPVAVGANVRSVSIDPTNQFLYVANGSAGTVTSYTLNAATGALTVMPGSPFAVGTSADYIATF